MPSPRIDARAARPNLLTLAKASASAKPDTTFAVDKATAASLVGRIPADLMGLDTATLELGKEGWQAEGSGEFLEVAFPEPVKHLDGPFARAFVDVDRQQVWFVTTKADKELQKAVKAFRNPPPDLLGDPTPPRIDVVGGVALGPLAKKLELATGPVDSFSGPKEGGKELTKAAVAKKARDFILERVGGGEGKLFPPVDGGNVGLSAMVLGDAAARKLIAAVKEGFPGSAPLKKLDFDPDRQKVFTVITSDDEPHLHLLVMDRKTGEISYLDEVNMVDLPLKPLGLDPESDDYFKALPAISKGADFLSLGSGSAGDRWWE